VSVPPATELLPRPARGRRFGATRTVRLGDVDPTGQLRLDAVARYLQDVASDDALDASLPNALGWVVRRTLIRIDHAAVLGEHLDLTTFCTGVGRSWAERRTSLHGDGGATIEAVSLWVQVDVDTGRPARLGHEFHAIYGEAADDRSVSSKLQLPARPTGEAHRQDWAFRRADLDPFGHVNNAAHWAVVEEVLQQSGGRRVGVGEIEYLTPADADDPGDLLVDGDLMWVASHGRTVTVARWLTDE
jgi:acyl-ACP thioesterase